MEEFSRENFSQRLHEFLRKENISVRQIAKAIGCSEATIYRLLDGYTHASNEMLNQANLMFCFGFKQYSKLSDAKKKKILELAGGVSGGVVGFGAIAFAINTMGLAGLSAAGITSGLAAIGGTMMGGVMVAAVAPVAVGAIGYAGIRGLKLLVENQKLKEVDIDPVWEAIPKVTDKKASESVEGELDSLIRMTVKIVIFTILSFAIVHYI